MSFLLQIESILRSDAPFDLTPGAINSFSTPGQHLTYCDSRPLWLARRDWTALGEIELLAQARAAGQVSGTFRVRRAYTETEQATFTAAFRRMYAAQGDRHIYLLISEAEHLVATEMGELYRPSLEAEGFLHASPANQLTRVANKHYRDAVGTRILVVALDRITPEVKWEPAAGSLYPHIYGPLNMSAVAYATPAPRLSDGQYRIQAADLDPSRAL